MIDFPNDYLLRCRGFDEKQMRAGNVHTGLFGVGTHRPSGVLRVVPTTPTAMLHFVVAGTGREILADSTKRDNGRTFPVNRCRTTPVVSDQATSSRTSGTLLWSMTIRQRPRPPITEPKVRSAASGRSVCCNFIREPSGSSRHEAAAELTGKVTPAKWPGATGDSGCRKPQCLPYGLITPRNKERFMDTLRVWRFNWLNPRTRRVDLLAAPESNNSRHTYKNTRCSAVGRT